MISGRTASRKGCSRSRCYLLKKKRELGGMFLATQKPCLRIDSVFDSAFLGRGAKKLGFIDGSSNDKSMLDKLIDWSW